VPILVTGAAGFIGGAVVRHLAAQQREVVAVDRSASALARVTGAAPGVVTAALDLGDRAGVKALLETTRPEAVIHLAWYASPVDYLTSHENLASLAMTAAFLEAAVGAGCRKLVVGGSCVEYALQNRPLIESDPVDPRTLYAACKQAAWHVARALAAEVGAELAWARIFHLHGPGEDGRRLIPWVASQLRSGAVVELTDGTQMRDHLHVADVASGLAALTAPGASGVYNVCSGQPVTLRQVLETVADVVGAPGGRERLRFGARPHRPNETMFLAGDATRLRTLGWAPRFALRDGLEDALRAPV
jgi:dTDP-6-deoxy-L-talose 4-dehydrogenase (NAD+)